ELAGEGEEIDAPDDGAPDDDAPDDEDQQEEDESEEPAAAVDGPAPDDDDEPVDEGAAGPVDRLCGSCADQGECGTAEDACLLDQTTGETFCARSCADAPCPAGYDCLEIDPSWDPQCVRQGE